MNNIRSRVVKSIFWFIREIMDSLFLIVIEGKENIPETGPAIIVSNHCSYLDAPLVGRIFYDKLMDIKWIISRSNYNLWFLKWFLIMVKPIVTNGTVEKAKKELQNGKLVIIFPEGGGVWRIREKYKKPKPGKGAAVIALTSGATIIPIGLSGTDKVLPPRSFRLSPLNIIIVHVGKPFKIKAVDKEKIDDALIENTTEEIMRHIEALKSDHDLSSIYA